MKKSAIILTAIWLGGCAATSVTSAGQKVLVSNSRHIPKKCRYLGEVNGSQGNFFTGNYTSDSHLDEGALNKMRNRAAEMGANYVQIITNRAGQFNSGGNGVGDSTATVIGNAYSCPQQDM